MFMPKKRLLFSLILFSLIVFGCSQADKEKTAEERLAEGDYTDKTTDHMVPGDYSELERAIDILLQAGSMIGDRHYDELEAAVNALEREGTDVSGLRAKLAKLSVAPRRGEQENQIGNDLEIKINGLEAEFDLIRRNNYQVSPEGFEEVRRKLDEFKYVDDGRINKLREEFLKLDIGGQKSPGQINQTQQNALDSEQQSAQHILRYCKGNGSVTLTSPPIRIEDLGFVVPRGVMTGHHVTPTDHGYITSIKWTNPGAKREDNIDKFADVLAPADGIVIGVESMPSVFATSTLGDYHISIYHTCTFYTVFIHVNEISDKLKTVLETRIPAAVKAGEVIGRAPGFDFSVFNKDVKLMVINPETYKAVSSMLNSDDLFAHFKEPVKAQLLEKNLRKAEPRGGKMDYDIDGTISGNWFVENTNGYVGLPEYNRLIGYWKTHLAFVYDPIDPAVMIVSMGEYDGRTANYAVKGNKPDFADVTKETGAIKYELVRYDYLENGKIWDIGHYADLKVMPRDNVEGVALVQMLENRKIKFEAFPGKAASQVNGFTSNAKIYER